MNAQALLSRVAPPGEPPAITHSIDCCTVVVIGGACPLFGYARAAALRAAAAVTDTAAAATNSAIDSAAAATGTAAGVGPAHGTMGAHVRETLLLTQTVRAYHSSRISKAGSCCVGMFLP